MKPGPKSQPRPEPVATVTRRGAFSTRYRVDGLPWRFGYRSFFATTYESLPMLVEYESRAQLMSEERQAELRPFLQAAIDRLNSAIAP